MPKDQCRVIGDNVNAGEGDHHIPTPWHNCVAELKDPNAVRKYVVVKARVIKQSLKDKRCCGRWTDDNKGLGAQFIIDRWT